jgi:citrate synthase
LIVQSIYMDATEAAAALRISKPTLYAYASRGQLRSEPSPGLSRERRYLRADIERLLERKDARRDPSKAAARGLYWGSPVLESGLTLIQDGRVYYRGQDVLALAREKTLEEVAELLWGVDRGRLFEQRPVLSGRNLQRLRAGAYDGPLSVLQAALPIGAALDPASCDLRPEAVRMAGARLVRMLTSVVVGRQIEGPVHCALHASWAPKQPAAREVIRTALVLCADHELNASAFVARCAAGAGASPYDVVSAALATLKGNRHGGATERLAAVFAEIGRPERARAVLSNRLRLGEHLPGFGHPLYPSGDPRAALLLNISEAAGNKETWRLVRAAARTGSELLQTQPNLDFGLVALARTYRLPDHAPLLLFALGRTVGWIGHAIEQYATGQLIRPRARYTGPPPAPDTVS